jgi:UDP-4-amino-4,6-dideoxy-N-acetyl-beta-L-altrosamine transaminase
MTIRYPYSRQDIRPEDVAAVVRALDADMLTQGPAVAEFEAALSQKLGCAHVVACNNGTSALHLAYTAAGLGPRRGLLTSPVTFLATANAARMLDAPVFFADVDPATGILDADSVRQVLESAHVPIGAICVVHLAGRSADMKPLRELASRYGAALVEDACHALGAVHPGGEGARVGGCSQSDLATFSFHAIKHVTTGGEGGAVCTNDAKLAARMRLLRSHGMTRNPEHRESDDPQYGPWSYEMQELGFNYRIPDVQCVLGTSQLARLDESLERRMRIANAYREMLAGANAISLPPPAENGTHAWHLFPIAIDFRGLGRTRGAIMRALAEDGIGSQVHYIPLYRQPYYASLGAKPLPGAERYYAATLSLPMYPQLTDDDVRFIADRVRVRLSP